MILDLSTQFGIEFKIIDEQSGLGGRVDQLVVPSSWLW